MNPIAASTVALVGVQRGLVMGKMTPGYFLPPFAESLGRHGIALKQYTYEDFGRDDASHRAAILIYSEDQGHPFTWALVERAEQIARRRGIFVVHPSSVGRMIADKRAAHERLSPVVRMPRRISDERANVPVFVNARKHSPASGLAHADTAIAQPGTMLDPHRHNTEWIDTRHEFRGKTYYIALRAHAVGRRCVSAFVRTRLVGEEASVHSSDSPLMPELMNTLHERLVVRNQAAIEEMCERASGILGLGFYAHDILPEAATGELFLCETNFKFDSSIYRAHLLPIARHLAFREVFTDAFPRRSGELFAEALLEHASIRAADRA